MNELNLTYSDFLIDFIKMLPLLTSNAYKLSSLKLFNTSSVTVTKTLFGPYTKTLKFDSSFKFELLLFMWFGDEEAPVNFQLELVNPGIL